MTDASRSDGEFINLAVHCLYARYKKTIVMDSGSRAATPRQAPEKAPPKERGKRLDKVPQNPVYTSIKCMYSVRVYDNSWLCRGKRTVIGKAVGSRLRGYRFPCFRLSTIRVLIQFLDSYVESLTSVLFLHVHHQKPIRVSPASKAKSSKVRSRLEEGGIRRAACGISPFLGHICTLCFVTC